ncbi:hypothetical protein N9F08_01010 [bacterium]|nr:hypothetical protein [bacterium]
MKDGQQVMYDDLIQEIEELKKWYILGKKNWKALFGGKITEMVASGVIAEATAKPLIGFLQNLSETVSIAL